MIRLEITIKTKYGYQSADLERAVNQALLAAVVEAAEKRDANVTRIQFLGPKKS